MIKKIFMTLIVALAALSAGAATERTTYTYAVKGNDTLKIDMYIDRSVEYKGKRPVMMYIHGGGYCGGHRKNAAQDVFCKHFAEMGWVAASIDYRLALPQQQTKTDEHLWDSTNPNAVNKYGVKTLYDVVKIACIDAIDATNFIIGKADEYGLDPQTIVIGGGSAGATTCLTLEYDVCNNEEYTKKLPEGFNYAGIISQAGAVDIRDRAELKLERKPCPVLFFHGYNDVAVPFKTREIAGEKWVGTLDLLPIWKKMGASYWAYIIPEADHIMAMCTLTDNNYETDRFVNEIVLGKQETYAFTTWEPADVPCMSSVEMMIKYAPLYILGYEKYVEEIDWGNMEKPQDVVY
jgi:hypothetical protein